MDKKYLINHCIYIVTTLIAAVLIGYVVFHLSGSGETNPSTAIAKRLTAGQTITEKGYIFKDESLLFATASGGVYSELKDGTKVSAGAAAAKVYDDPEGLLESIAAYDKAIALLTEANGKQSAEKVDLQLRELTAELRRSFEEGNAAAIERKAEQLQVLLDLRKTATGAKDNYTAEIAQLKSARQSLLKELGEAKETILAPTAGNYYKTCDGYETLFTGEAAEGLDIDSFLELTNGTRGDQTAKELLAGKLLESSTWYLALLTENGSASEMTAGQSYTLTLSSKGDFEMTLDKVLTDRDEGRTLLVFKSNLVPSAGLLQRSEQVSLQVAKVTGLMVPTAAVRYLPPEQDTPITDQTGVYVKEGNKLIFKRIRILCQSDGYYVVKEFSQNEEHAKSYLALNDVIVTSGKELEEGYRN